MNIASVTFIKNKNDCVKATLNSTLLPLTVKKYWIFENTLSIPLPDSITPVTYAKPEDGLNINLVIDILKSIFLHGKHEAILNVSPDIILFKPECFIAPIFNSNIDFCYIKKSPTEYYVPITDYQCYSISGRGIAYFDNTDFSKMNVMHNGNVDYIITHFLSTINPWPLISQIDETLVANNAHISQIEKTVIGKYDNMSNNEALKFINEVLEKQGKPALDLTDKLEYFNKLKN